MCPWDRFAPATLEFCEHLLNGWVRQPANTISNFGFVLVGILLWVRTPSEKAFLRVFSIGSILVGFTSAFYHLSMTFVAQFFDVSSMFLTVGILVVLNAMRLRWLPQKFLYHSLVAMQFSAMLLMFIFQGDLGEKIFAGQVTFLALSEVALIIRVKPRAWNYRWWFAAIAAYLSATLVWAMDIKKIWCSPDNHWFNGHSAWHILNAVVVLCMYKFYEEAIVFEEK